MATLRGGGIRNTIGSLEPEDSIRSPAPATMVLGRGDSFVSRFTEVTMERGERASHVHRDAAECYDHYDDASWDSSRRFSFAYSKNYASGVIEQVDRRSSRSLTEFPGPYGTTGRDPTRMDSNQFAKLIQEGYSTGLAQALCENARKYDFRFWVVDNSGSMLTGDGRRFVRKNGKLKAVACTRWEEIQDTVNYHAQMATVLDSPTIFKLLNDTGMRTAPQTFSVGEHRTPGSDVSAGEVANIMKKVTPNGVTPLTQHIHYFREHISGMATELRRSGKVVALVLATDGLPTDELGNGGDDITNEFIQALRSLESLPVWTVIRLCTDEVAVTQFYNALDAHLEISIEVLDDYTCEAQEVYKHNPWITYSLPLHRCRELGYHERLFDLIDERPLTAGEVRSFCCLLFGLPEVDLPDPGEGASAFVKAVKTILQREQLQWNPIKKKRMPWIVMKDLKKVLSNRKFWCI